MPKPTLKSKMITKEPAVKQQELESDNPCSYSTPKVGGPGSPKAIDLSAAEAGETASRTAITTMSMTRKLARHLIKYHLQIRQLVSLSIFCAILSLNPFIYHLTKNVNLV